MAKRETKEAQQAAKSASESVSSSYDPLREEAGKRASDMSASLSPQRDAITGGYRSMMEDPRDIVARQISAQNVGFNRVADPRATNVDALREVGDYYKTFRDTGGLSQENIDRIRGSGGYDEFAKTGGYTPESIANIKAQAISPIGSFATGTRDELTRRRNLQGGYAPGFDAANKQLQREAARGIADASLNANVSIQDRINAGRQWGISGISAAETGLSSLQTGNKLAAAAAEAGIAKSLADLDAADIQRLMETGMFNSRGELDAAIANQQANLQADQYNASAGDRASYFNLQNQQDQYARGIAGLEGLYTDDRTIQQKELDRQLATQTQEDAARADYLRIQAGIGAQPGIGSNIMSGIGTGAGLASQYFKRGSVPATTASTTGAGITGGTSYATGAGGLTNFAGSGLTTGLSGTAPTVTSQGVSGIAGGGGSGAGSSAIGTAGYAALPAAAAVLTYGIGEKGWGRGGEEGAFVNPSRDTASAAYQSKYGGDNPQQAMTNALNAQGISGPEADRIISNYYGANTKASWTPAVDQMAYATASPEERANITATKDRFLAMLSPAAREKWLAGRGRTYDTV